MAMRALVMMTSAMNALTDRRDGFASRVDAIAKSGLIDRLETSIEGV
jgi:hypothetical protein